MSDYYGFESAQRANAQLRESNRLAQHRRSNEHLQEIHQLLLEIRALLIEIRNVSQDTRDLHNGKSI